MTSILLAWLVGLMQAAASAPKQAVVETTAGPDELAHRSAVDVLHGKEGLIVGLTEFIDSRYVRMGETRSGLRFTHNVEAVVTGFGKN